MNPLFLAALTSFAPSLFGGLFQRNDPQERLRKQLMQLFSEGNVSNTTNRFYNQYLGSPAYARGQGQIAATTNSLTNSLSRSLGARGLTTSGIGAVAPGIARSTAGFNMAGLNASAYQQAVEQAMRSIQSQAGALQGVGPSPNYGHELFGAGLNFFGPFLQDWMKKYNQQPVMQ